MIFLSFSSLLIILKGDHCKKEALITAYDKLLNYYPYA
jgi:hypothetical protein